MDEKNVYLIVYISAVEDNEQKCLYIIVMVQSYRIAIGYSEENGTYTLALLP